MSAVAPWREFVKKRRSRISVILTGDLCAPGHWISRRNQTKRAARAVPNVELTKFRRTNTEDADSSTSNLRPVRGIGRRLSKASDDATPQVFLLSPGSEGWRSSLSDLPPFVVCRLAVAFLDSKHSRVEICSCSHSLAMPGTQHALTLLEGGDAS